MSETTPAGWYPAPHAGNELRYWDGTGWHAAPAYLPTDGASGPASAPPVTPTTPAASSVPPGYRPFPGRPIMPPRPQGLAIAALVLGIAAFVTAWVPFVGIAIALTGLVFGVIALLKRQPKGLAVTGTVLSGLATVWGVVVVFSIVSLFWIPTDSSGGGGEAAPLPEASEPLDGCWAATDAAGSGAGSLDDPRPLPYVSESSSGAEYSVEARVVDEDATDEVAGWNEYNESAPAGQRYVLVEMTVTGLDPEGTAASNATYDLSLATPDGAACSSAFVVAADDTTLLADAGTIAEGETATGLVAYLVPADATDLLLLAYPDYYSF